MVSVVHKLFQPMATQDGLEAIAHDRRPDLCKLNFEKFFFIDDKIE